MSSKLEQVISLAEQKGVIRPIDLAEIGVDHRYLSALLSNGRIIKAGRGLYSLSDYDVTEAHTLVEAVRAQSQAIICLLSALNFHGIGTQIPHEVWVSIPYGAWVSEKKTIPMRVIVMRPPSYDFGIETHNLEGVDVPIYNIPKTIADCFKFRNKIGLDVALEALRDVLRGRKCSREDIRAAARVNRVEKVMRPYMEALAE